MTTLHKDQYNNFIIPSFYVTLAAGIICVLLYAIATCIPLRRDARVSPLSEGDKQFNGEAWGEEEPKNAMSMATNAFAEMQTSEEGAMPLKAARQRTQPGSGAQPRQGTQPGSGAQPRRGCRCMPVAANTEVDGDAVEETANIVRGLLLGTIALLVLMIVLLWTIVVTTNHRDAVDDLLEQLANSTDTILRSSLENAAKMVKQATNTWQFTGAIVTDLTHTSVWVPDMLGELLFLD